MFQGPYQPAVEQVEDPKIEQPLDAVIRITTANICGSDLHPYEGRATGGIGVVGVYEPTDPGASTEDAREGRDDFDFGTAFTKGISIGTGQCPAKRYNRQLRDLIIRGRASPSVIVSPEVSLDEAVDAYDKFDKRVDGWAKVLLHPAG